MLRFALPILLVVLVAAGCGPSQPVAQSASRPAESPATSVPPAANGSAAQSTSLLPVRSAYTTIAGSVAPWWVAADAGYFREQGLDVQLARVDPGAALLAAMSNGELDVVYTGGPTMILGYLQGLDTMLVGSTFNRLDNSIWTRPNLQRPEDLRGKTIGVTRLKAVSDVTVRLAMQQVGLQPGTDFVTRGTGGYAESLAALEMGVVEGAGLSPEMGIEARQRGYREMLNAIDLDLQFVNGGVGATKRVLEAQPEMIDRYLRALAQAINRLKTDREFAIQVFSKYSRNNDLEQVGAIVDYYRPLLLADLYITPRAVQTTLDAEEHPGARTLQPSDVVDYRFLERLRASGFLDTLPSVPAGS